VSDLGEANRSRLRKQLASTAELGAPPLLTGISRRSNFAQRANRNPKPNSDQIEIESATVQDRAASLLERFRRASRAAHRPRDQANGQVVFSPSLPAGSPSSLSSLAEDHSNKFITRQKPGWTSGSPSMAWSAKTWIVPIRYGVYDPMAARYYLGTGLSVDFLMTFWKERAITRVASLGIIRDDGFLLSRYPTFAQSTSPEKLYGTAAHGRNDPISAPGGLSGIRRGEGYTSSEGAHRPCQCSGGCRTTRHVLLWPSPPLTCSISGGAITGNCFCSRHHAGRSDCHRLTFSARQRAYDDPCAMRSSLCSSSRASADVALKSMPQGALHV